MNNKRHLSCPRPIMSGPNFAYRTLTVSDYNHAVHRICSKLQFCEKEPSDADKIEKALSTMLPSERILQQQYRERNFQVYSDLIHTLLEAEKHSELMVWNN